MCAGRETVSADNLEMEEELVPGVDLSQNGPSPPATKAPWEDAAAHLILCSRNLTDGLTDLETVSAYLRDLREYVNGMQNSDLLEISYSDVTIPMTVEAVLLAKRIQVRKLQEEISVAFDFLNAAIDRLDLEAQIGAEKAPSVGASAVSMERLEEDMARSLPGHKKPPESPETRVVPRSRWPAMLRVGSGL